MTIENVFALTPSSKSIEYKSNTVARTDTAGKKLFLVPKGATIISATINGVSSDAGTTATISLGTTQGGNELFSDLNVLAAAKNQQVFTPDQKPADERANDTAVFGTYAESGTASAQGGPWLVTIGYIRNIIGSK